jgi:hypothetical protein
MGADRAEPAIRYLDLAHDNLSFGGSALEPCPLDLNRMGLGLPLLLRHLAGAKDEAGPAKAVLKRLDPPSVVEFAGRNAPLAKATLEQFSSGSLKPFIGLTGPQPGGEGVLELLRRDWTLIARVVPRLVRGVAVARPRHRPRNEPLPLTDLLHASPYLSGYACWPLARPQRAVWKQNEPRIGGPEPEPPSAHHQTRGKPVARRSRHVCQPRCENTQVARFEMPTRA